VPKHFQFNANCLYEWIYENIETLTGWRKDINMMALFATHVGPEGKTQAVLVFIRLSARVQ
jgi:hypothetical protein